MRYLNSAAIAAIQKRAADPDRADDAYEWLADLVTEFGEVLAAVTATRTAAIAKHTGAAKQFADAEANALRSADDNSDVLCRNLRTARLHARNAESIAHQQAHPEDCDADCFTS